jgi:putative radical SAM enzyme (TIGR03279 family)
MSAPRVVAVAPGSPAARAGVQVGDDVLSVDGEVPRDVIAWRLLADRADVEVEVRRGGLDFTVDVAKREGEPLGIDVHSAVFDAVRTCDNHCEFCFIYQLPKGMRTSLYLKDDDYRLSFLYGNFTTLTRFTEADLERVVTEGLSPINVSIHATDPEVRAAMLRNRRGATCLRWLRALLDHGVTVHGQLVVCPGVNDGTVLDDTMVGVLDRYPDLASVCVVPLGVSRFNTEGRMRPHTVAEAGAVLDTVHEWQAIFSTVLGRRLVYAADEYYLLAGRPFPPAERYDGFPMHEDGIGMARTFEREFLGQVDDVVGPQRGFFAWADATPPNPSAYTALRAASTPVKLTRSPRRDAPIAIVTAPYGASVLGPLVATLERDDVRLVAVGNDFFGGNIAVTGLMVGADLSRVLASEPESHRYLLPDVCLTDGRFLDGQTPADLPRQVEVIPTDGRALRRALERT